MTDTPGDSVRGVPRVTCSQRLHRRVALLKQLVLLQPPGGVLWVWVFSSLMNPSLLSPIENLPMQGNSYAILSWQNCHWRSSVGLCLDFLLHFTDFGNFSVLFILSCANILAFIIIIIIVVFIIFFSETGLQLCSPGCSVDQFHSEFRESCLPLCPEC